MADTGVGLESQDREKIFRPFEQVESSSRRKYHGTGLGLSLTKNLVELHQGRIWAESRGPNNGATFRFVIPANSPMGNLRTPSGFLGAGTEIAKNNKKVIDIIPIGRGAVMDPAKKKRAGAQGKPSFCDEFTGGYRGLWFRVGRVNRTALGFLAILFSLTVNGVGLVPRQRYDQSQVRKTSCASRSTPVSKKGEQVSDAPGGRFRHHPGRHPPFRGHQHPRCPADGPGGGSSPDRRQ